MSNSNSTSNGCVYAIGTQSGLYVKFGWTSNVQRRLAQLQTGCPEAVIVLATAKWDRKYEAAIHKMLKHRNSMGEWFHASEETNRVIGMISSGNKAELDAHLSSEASNGKPRNQDRIGIDAKGAIELLLSGLFNRQTQVILVLIANSTLDGKCWIHPDNIASEISMDSSYVRKAIKDLEANDFLFRSINKNGGHCYWLNPKYVNSMDSRLAGVLHQTWVTARDKEKKARRAKQASPASGR